MERNTVYMEPLTIVGCILAIVIGVLVIVYILFHSPANGAHAGSMGEIALGAEEDDLPEPTDADADTPEDMPADTDAEAESAEVSADAVSGSETEGPGEEKEDIK